MGLEEIDRIQNAARDRKLRLFRFLFDMLSQVQEVTYCPARPNDVHLGALVSPRFPQDFNHFEIFG